MLVNVVGWASLVAGVGCLIMALYTAYITKDERKKAREVIEKATKRAEDVTDAESGEFQQQAGPLSSALESVAAVATALKDLDRVAQLLTVSLGYFAIAAVAAGLEEVAQNL